MGPQINSLDNWIFIMPKCILRLKSIRPSLELVKVKPVTLALDEFYLFQTASLPTSIAIPPNTISNMYSHQKKYITKIYKMITKYQIITYQICIKRCLKCLKQVISPYNKSSQKNKWESSMMVETTQTTKQCCHTIIVVH